MSFELEAQEILRSSRFDCQECFRLNASLHNVAGCGSFRATFCMVTCTLQRCRRGPHSWSGDSRFWRFYLLVPTGLTLFSRSIVFIHGLQGHPRSTWTKKVDVGTSAPTQASSAKRRWRQTLGFRPKQTTKDEQTSVPSQTSSEIFWPADLLPRDCSNARILTFGYESHVASFFGGAVNQNNLSANAKNLLFALTRSRKDCVSALACTTLLCVSLVHSLSY